MPKKRFYWDNAQDVVQLVQSLHNNNISICTTDTVIGLLSNTSKEAFERLNGIKGRAEKPYLILILSKKEIFQFVNIQTENVEQLIDYCWPGPLTLIFKAKSGVPDFMQSRQGTIALRNPDHQGLQSVMKLVGPLFSTSANLAGQPIPETINQIKPEIFEKIDMIVSDRKENVKSVPSTILNCTDPKNIKVVREGAYSIQELEKIYGKKFLK